MGYLATIYLLALVAISCSGSRNHAGGVTYYVSPEGEDLHSGTSQSDPWKTIDKVNETDFSPGDAILFEGGREFEGCLILTSEDSGTDESRVKIGAYGEGKAIINGGAGEAINVDSCKFLTIENLELAGLGRKTGNTSDGLFALHCDGIAINQLEVYGFQKSGIHVRQCQDASITRVYARENGFAGIHVTGATMRDSVNYDNHNLYIGYCVAENNPGDPTVLTGHSGNGILASSVKGGIIEYCEAFNNGWDMPWTGNGPVGIWIWDATDVVIQYCIAHHNRTNPEAADGGGFDFDGGVSNCTIQYCISHNNEGAGFGLYEFGAAKPWEHNVVRYNLSQDDGIINGGCVGIWKNDDRGMMRHCQVYNNTFYNSKEEGADIWLYDHYSGFEFRNNLFVYNGPFLSGGKTIRDEVFEGNLYWNLSGDPSFEGFESLEEWAKSTGHEMLNGEFRGIYADPMLEDAGSVEVTDPEMINPESLAGYFPVSGSPLVDAGLNLRELYGVDPGNRDLAGTSIPVNGNYEIGAVEYNGQ